MTSAREADERMTAEAFIAWADSQTSGKRFELLDGLPYTMSSEQATHARLKLRIVILLGQEIVSKSLDCEVFGDGMAVHVDDENVFEPDATVVCGTPVPGKTVLLQAPRIVVEVGSPSTQRIDATVKLARYFRNPHIMHYLIVIPTAGSVVHHRRGDADAIVTTTHEDGSIKLDPAGLDIRIQDIFAVLQP